MIDDVAVVTRTLKQSRCVDGLLLLDKPEGPSSNQALQYAKRLLGARKAGHTGTLDPFATGLLPLAFGEATKFSGYLLDAYKTYEATLILGIRTTTGDITGEIVERLPVRCSESDVRSALASFMGTQLQTPPMYSAIKRDGVPLYRLARRGEAVVREPRTITISELDFLGLRGDEVDLRIRCSKGTYIRVLGEDVGTALGCCAALGRLRRTQVAKFDIADAHTFAVIESIDPDARSPLLLPMDAGLDHIPRVDCGIDDVLRIRLGQSVPNPVPQLAAGLTVRMYGAEKSDFLGLARVVDGRIQPMRLIVPNSAKIS